MPRHLDAKFVESVLSVAARAPQLLDHADEFPAREERREVGVSDRHVLAVPEEHVEEEKRHGDVLDVLGDVLAPAALRDVLKGLDVARVGIDGDDLALHDRVLAAEGRAERLRDVGELRGHVFEAPAVEPHGPGGGDVRLEAEAVVLQLSERAAAQLLHDLLGRRQPLGEHRAHGDADAELDLREGRKAVLPQHARHEADVAGDVVRALDLGATALIVARNELAPAPVGGPADAAAPRAVCDSSVTWTWMLPCRR